ncbi:hypothetical protein [Chitinophaga sp.]|uniref:hypothetical protein n=1 Tax=Chitinophaga sp. TaxID=1869181 RepID=UPI0031E0EABB
MKYLSKQKNNFLLYCIVMILSNLPLYAQLTQRVITITRPLVDIPELAKTIAAQTGVEYSLNMQNTSLKKSVHLKPGKWKLEDVMREVQLQVGLDYKILGDHILFTDYKPAKKQDMVPAKPGKVLPAGAKSELAAAKSVPAATKKVSAPPKSTLAQVKSTQAPPKRTPAAAKSASAGAKSEPIATKSTPAPDQIVPAPAYPAYVLSPLRSDYYITSPAPYVAPRHMTINERKVSNTKEAPPEKERRHIALPQGWASPLAEAGITANDIVYLSASVKAGIQYFYGIATLGFSFRGMRFRYGAGIRVPLNEYTALHAEFTTGALSRKSIDTVPQVGLLHERMNSYGLSWSRTIRPRLNLQVEVNYSTLKKSNDSTVNKVNMETHYFGYGTPVYNAGIGSNGKYSELYTWVGARVSIFYNLRRK